MTCRSHTGRINSPIFSASFMSGSLDFDNLDELLGFLTIGTLFLASLSSALPIWGLLIAKYIEENLQYILKIVLKAKAPTSASEKPQEYPLKAKFPNIYYKKSHMDYYHFCQQYKDYFNTIKVKSYYHIFFAIFFFFGHISFYWH